MWSKKKTKKTREPLTRVGISHPHASSPSICITSAEGGAQNAPGTFRGNPRRGVITYISIMPTVQ